MKGRAHLYEGHPADRVVFGVRVLGPARGRRARRHERLRRRPRGPRARRPRARLRPPQPAGNLAARRAERRHAGAALPRHERGLRPCAARDRPRGRRAARPVALGGRLRGLARPGVRDAGGDPDDPRPRRRPRRDVDRARGARRAPHGHPLPRDLVRDEHGGGHPARADRRRARARGRRAGPGPADGAARRGPAGACRQRPAGSVPTLRAWRPRCERSPPSTACSRIRGSPTRRGRSRSLRPAPRSNARATRSGRAGIPGDLVEATLARARGGPPAVAAARAQRDRCADPHQSRPRTARAVRARPRRRGRRWLLESRVRPRRGRARLAAGSSRRAAASGSPAPRRRSSSTTTPRP